MDNKEYNNVLLSVSNKNLKCNELSQDLMKIGIMCSITPNTSILCKNNICWKENGCSILLNYVNYQEVAVDT